MKTSKKVVCYDDGQGYQDHGGKFYFDQCCARGLGQQVVASLDRGRGCESHPVRFYGVVSGLGSLLKTGHSRDLFYEEVIEEVRAGGTAGAIADPA